MMPTETSARPVALTVCPEEIPGELKALNQWVAWKYVFKEERWTKVPVSPHTGRRGSVDDPATWAEFDRAVSRYQQQRLDGIGLVLTPDDPFVGVDVDGCRDPGTGVLGRKATEIVDLLRSYTEVSPSGK